MIIDVVEVSGHLFIYKKKRPTAVLAGDCFE